VPQLGQEQIESEFIYLFNPFALTLVNKVHSLCPWPNSTVQWVVLSSIR